MAIAKQAADPEGDQNNVNNIYNNYNANYASVYASSGYVHQYQLSRCQLPPVDSLDI